MQRVFELLAQSLDQHGVDQLFGLIGDANLYMVHAWASAGSGQYTGCAHEANAVLAALGYAQVSGRTGVATVTHGPGLTNAITALVEGVRGGIPMVLLCGDTPPDRRDHLQKIDQREMVKAAGAGFIEMRRPDTAAIDLARAFRRAALERRPIVFNMRVDLQWLEVDTSPVVLPIPSVRHCVVEGDDLDLALGIIASAKRPCILAGRGAIAADAREAILKMAERIEAPVATTLLASGLFHGEPFNLGVLGTLSRPVALDTIAKSDCVIAFGASLTIFTLGGGRVGGLLSGKRVVQILGDWSENERRTDHDVLLIADPALMANAIVEALDLAEIPPSQNANQELADALLQEATTWAEPLSIKPTAPGTIDCVPALRRIHQALPVDRTLVTDVGRFMLSAWRNFPVNHPRHFVGTFHFASVGLGLGQAIGAAPERLTVLVVGDGGFSMGAMTDLATVVREQLNVAIVLCNDGSFGAEYVQFTSKNLSPAMSLTNPPDCVAMATSAGLAACRVTNPDELDIALALLAEGTGPRLVELRLDPARMPQE